MSKISQFHTTIPAQLLNKFKGLCKQHSIPVSIGIKLLIKKSLNSGNIPGMQELPHNASGISSNIYMSEQDSRKLEKILKQESDGIDKRLDSIYSSLQTIININHKKK